MSKSGYLCLTFMLLVGGLSFFLQREAIGISFVLIALFSCSYFVFFLVKNNLHHGIIRGVLLSILVMAIGLIPVLGWIVVIGFVIYNISKALEGLKSLAPDAVASLVIYGLLCSRLIFDIRDPAAIAGLAGAYVIVAVLYCRSLKDLSTEHALFKMSMMWLSIPFVVLTIISIVSALGNLFRTIGSTLTRTIITPQTVSAHMRGGLQIDSYTRNISSTVTDTVMHTVPGSGVVTSAVAAEVAQKVKEDQDR